jgi:hypothetical protein
VILLLSLGNEGDMSGNKKPPLTNRQKASEGYHNAQVGQTPTQHALPAEYPTTRGVEIESPSTLCIFRIEGLVKSPLTDTDHRYGWSQAYGDLGLMSPCFMHCRIGDVAQFCQYEKPPFLPHE